MRRLAVAAGDVPIGPSARPAGALTGFKATPAEAACAKGGGKPVGGYCNNPASPFARIEGVA